MWLIFCQFGIIQYVCVWTDSIKSPDNLLVPEWKCSVCVKICRLHYHINEAFFLALTILTNINILIMYYIHYTTHNLFRESRVEKKYR